MFSTFMWLNILEESLENELLNRALRYEHEGILEMKMRKHKYDYDFLD